MYKQLQRLVASFIILSLLMAVLPQSTRAQSETNPISQEESEDWQSLQELYRVEIQSSQTSRSTSELDIVQATDRPEMAPLVGSCFYVALTSEQDPPGGSQLVTKVTEGTAPHGQSWYQGEFGNQRLPAWQMGSVPDDWQRYYRVAVRNRSEQKARVNIVQIKDDGSPLDEVYIHEVPADSHWYVFEGPAQELNLMVSADQNSVGLDFDAVSIIGCDTEFVNLPLLQVGTGSQAGQPPLNCGTGNTGRWRIGSETNEQIERSMWMVPGSVWNHPSNSNFACWSETQKEAYNWETGVKLDFQQDRSNFRNKLLIPVAAISLSNISLPWWSSGVAAVTEGISAFASGTALVAASGWAAVVGTLFGIGYIGWQANLAEMEMRTETIHPHVQRTWEGRTFISQHLVERSDLYTAQLYVYRISDALTTSGLNYQSWVEEEQILSYLTIQGDPNLRPRGFFFSRQYYPEHALSEHSYSFPVLLGAADLMGRIQEGVGLAGTNKEPGAISDKEVRDLLENLDRYFDEDPNNDPVPIPIDPNDPEKRANTCVDPIPLTQVRFDIDDELVNVDSDVRKELKEMAVEEASHDTYQFPWGGRVFDSHGALGFDGHYFRDGYHTFDYVCVKITTIDGGQRLGWIFWEDLGEDFRYPYEYSDTLPGSAAILPKPIEVV